MHDLETILVLVLLAFNFISKRLHHSLTLPRSWFRDSAAVTLTPGDGKTTEWSHRHHPSAYPSKRKKNSEVYRKNNNGPKTLPCATPDATLTSLLQQQIDFAHTLSTPYPPSTYFRQQPYSHTVLNHSLHVSKPSQYSLIHSTHPTLILFCSSTHLFIHNSIHS